MVSPEECLARANDQSAAPLNIDLSPNPPSNPCPGGLMQNKALYFKLYPDQHKPSKISITSSIDRSLRRHPCRPIFKPKPMKLVGESNRKPFVLVAFLTLQLREMSNCMVLLRHRPFRKKPSGSLRSTIASPSLTKAPSIKQWVGL